MKIMLLATLILSGVISAQAQKIEVGVNGGMNPYIPMSESEKSVKVNGYAGARVALNLADWQVGLGGELYGIRSEMTIDWLKIDEAHRPYTLYTFGNKLFKLPKSYAYAGLNGGLVSGMTSSVLPHTGFSFGVQGGYTLNVIRGFGINTEVSARYNRLIFGDAGYYTVHLTFPVSVGVRYTF